MTRTDLQSRANRLRSRRVPFVLATVVRAERPTSAKAGDCALVLPDGTIVGFVGGSCAESTVRLHGLRLLQTGESTLLRITPSAQDGPQESVEGLVTVGNPCLSGGTLEIFLEAVVPATLVQVYGEAPVARALISIGRAVGYDVRAITDAEAPIPPDTDAVVVASHGRDEERLLAAALAAGVRYVALVASRRRGAAVLATLPSASRSVVRTPAGLDIGARTASEVALSVLAELVATRPRRDEDSGEGPDEGLDEGAGEGLDEGAGAGSGDTTGGASAAPSVAPADAVDPVCGMTVAVTPASLQLEHDGLTFYFCGPGCQHAFADEPGRYRDS